MESGLLAAAPMFCSNKFSFVDMPVFYKQTEATELRRVDNARYSLKWEWFQINWPHGDTVCRGEDIWGKSKPCKPGMLYCKPCNKEISYGTRGKINLDDHVKTMKHQSNTSSFLKLVSNQPTLGAGFMCERVESEQNEHGLLVSTCESRCFNL